jgi:mannose-6-phosphate isomerase
VERLGPLILEPHLAERVWGGGAFGSGIGEAWDLSVHPNGPSTVVGGRHDGATLAEVVDADVDAFGGPIDLLAKRLDCAENLSVQVHPTDGDPKTESWVILDAQPGAGVFHGFRRTLDRAEVETAALDGSIMDLLAFHEVARGDCVFVPAGTVHAIGGGLLLFELQQSSDTTFRLYDYGRGRELHLEQGLEVAELGPAEPNHAPAPLSDGHRLVSCAHFHVDEVTGTTITLYPGDRWQALLVLSGTGTTGDNTAAAGRTLLVPATAGPTNVHGPCTALRYGPGPGESRARTSDAASI